MRRAVIAMLLASLAACGGADRRADPSPTPTTSEAKRPTSTGRLTIVEPQPGTQVPADRPVVRLKLEGATLLEEASADLRPDTGHVHITLDGTTISLLAGLEANLNDLLAEKDLPPLTKGQHLLQAEFAAADHGFFDPRVVVTTTFVAV